MDTICTGLVIVAVLSTTGADALSCYACVPREQIAGVPLPATIANKTVYFPHCDQIRANAPDDRFRMTCPVGLNRSCIKIRDDRGNEMRSCFSSAEERCTKATKQGQVLCMCRGNFCNSAPAALTPAAALGALSLTLCLLRPRY
ncbi:uncharacterized protein LOC122369559 [Amphibalanus amphitrite]|uniref:uncharacterized protein LOC122369559 n=1 Tax=Amphibalanus amphitrite TaxID=1232801 RepID=UPI001C91E81C|nr:uncharacterized protein LOC122369559 [Amphibalanus amphitrite]